jgi:hypothetical protein
VWQQWLLRRRGFLAVCPLQKIFCEPLPASTGARY